VYTANKQGSTIATQPQNHSSGPETVKYPAKVKVCDWKASSIDQIG